jgi:hypothetical protein
MKTNTNRAHRARITVLFLFFGIILSAHPPKTQLRGDTIFHEGLPYAILKHSGPGLLLNYTLHELSGKEVARIIVNTVPASAPNYVGEKITFWTFDFFEKELIADCEVKASNKKKLAEMIVHERLFDGGKLNIEAARYFIRVNGNQFTKPKECNKENRTNHN